MKIKSILIVSLFSILFLNSCGNECISKSDSIYSIDKCIEQYINKWNYKSALDIAIYGKQRNFCFNYRSGYSSILDNTTIHDDSVFILYSITKSMTAAVIVDLVNKGQLSFDNKVEDFFEDVNSIYINKDATIEELLTHRSGIQDYSENPSLIYANPFVKNNEWDPKLILDYIIAPAEDRGTFIYSSTNYILLGLIIEQVTSQKLTDIFQKELFDRFNLNMVLYPSEKLDFTKIVHPHVYPNTFMGLYGDGKTPIDICSQIKGANELLIKSSWASGAVVSNANNTAKWGYELLSEYGKVDSKIKLKILNSVSTVLGESSETKKYGYGIRKIKFSNYEFIGSYGRSFGSENLMFYNKDKDVCIVILSGSNTRSDGNPNIDELLFEIFNNI